MERFRPSVPRAASAGAAYRAPIGLLLLLLLLVPPSAAADDPPEPAEARPAVNQPYRICAGDTLEVVYALQASVYRTTAVVRTDGRISLPFVDDVPAAGMRLDEMSAMLREKYSVVYRHPRIDVILRNSVAARAFVGGEVDFAGIISLRHPVTVHEALILAGGPSPHGDMSRVVVVRKKSPTETDFFELDLTDRKASLEEGGMFYLEAGDLVLIPMRGVSKLRLWIRQYVYRTLSLSLTTDFFYLYQVFNLNSYYRF